MKWDILQDLIQLEISMKDLMVHGSRSKSITDTIITSALSADAARSIRKAITVRIAEGRCRKEKKND
jgi:hypothetical protein